MKIFKFVFIVIVALCIMVTTCYAAGDTDDGNDEPHEYYEQFVSDASLIAKLLYRECRGVASTTEKAAVAWVVMNRVDDENYPNTVREVIMQRNQFASIKRTPVDPELYELAEDVLRRYTWEQMGFTDVGRVIPEDYLWFAGKNGKNTFRNRFSTSRRWDFSLESPYEN